jgi:hypothetical protein
MKKVSFFVCLLALFSVLSCQKEPGLGVDAELSDPSSFLRFELREDFEEAASKASPLNDAPKGFVSLQSVLQLQDAAAKKEGQEDKIPEPLARLLNKDGVVQIGKWICKLDFEEERVYVIADDQQKRLYQALVKKQKNKDIYVFSFEDEVLTLLEEGYTASPSLTDTPNGRMSFSCGGGISVGEGTFEASVPIYSTCTGLWAVGGTPNTSFFVIGTDYDKYGVWFRLRFRIRSTITPMTPNGSFSNCLKYGSFLAHINITNNCNSVSNWPSDPSGAMIYDLQYTGTNWAIPGSVIYGQIWNAYSSSRGIRCFRILNVQLLNQQPHPWNVQTAGVCPN